MSVALLLFLGLQLLQVLSLELQDVIGCDHDEVTLECDEGSFVAVHEGRFTNNDTEGLATCSQRDEESGNTNTTTCSEDIRAFVNNKCSGRRNCSFMIDHNHSSRECREPGTIIISYDCVHTNKVHRFCNRHITDTEGYLQSPKYPMYYPGPMNCRWTINATEGQRILVFILDLSLTETLTTECPDYFTLHDGQVELLRTCGEKAGTLRQYESENSQVTVTLSSRMIGTRRGFLIWYKAIGCPTLAPPEHGYLVYRNISFAQYMCCTKHYFEDTIERTRNFQCIDANHWNDTIGVCLDMQTLKEIKNVTEVDFIDDFRDDPIPSIPFPEPDMTFDIVVPSVIMATLIVGNFFIVFILLKLRKSVKEEPDVDPGEFQPVTEVQKWNVPPKPSLGKDGRRSSVDQITAPGMHPSTSQNRKTCIVTDV